MEELGKKREYIAYYDQFGILDHIVWLSEAEEDEKEKEDKE